MKIAKKLDCLFWWLVAVLPLLLYCIVYFKSATAITFNEFIEPFRFDFVANSLEQIASTASIAIPTVLINYLSYFVVVEIAHLFIDAIIFLPKFARTALEGVYDKLK